MKLLKKRRKKVSKVPKTPIDPLLDTRISKKIISPTSIGDIWINPFHFCLDQKLENRTVVSK